MIPEDGGHLVRILIGQQGRVDFVVRFNERNSMTQAISK
jgi:hypothetical protein